MEPAPVILIPSPEASPEAQAGHLPLEPVSVSQHDGSISDPARNRIQRMFCTSLQT